MQQQQSVTPKSLQESLALSEEKSTEDCDSSSEADNTMRKESMLLKAHYFCRIGMGTKSIQSMSSETQRKMNTYFHEKTTTQTQESLTVTPSTSDHTQVPDDDELPVILDSKASLIVDMDENPEEWVKRSLMKRNMLQKAQLLSRMGMGPQSLEAMTSCVKARLTKYHQEQYDELENPEALNDRPDLNNSGSSNEGEVSFDFVEKTDEEARNCYYDKLIQMKVLKMTPSKKNQSIIIFDWDDTLLCTSYVVALGTRGVAPSVVSVLKPVDINASKLLDKTAESGQVFIVTNAEEGWVQYSAKVFLPETYKVIMKREIVVVSARTCYQEQFPGDSSRWKKEAFTSLMKYFERDIVTNLICIGDSHIEMDAAHILAKQFDKAIVKTIKFKENPRPEELAKQQHLVLEKFEQIFVSLRNTTIKLEKKSV